jgi:flagellar protein FliL
VPISVNPRSVALWGECHGIKAETAAKQDAGADSDEDEAAPPKRKLPLKLILIAAGVMVLLGGAGIAGYLVFGSSKEAKVANASVKPPAFVDVPEVLVNLFGTGVDRTQYLKVKIVLEIPDALLQPQIQSSMPRVMDAFQTYLRELRPSDLDGSAGLYRLKEELTRRVNAAISPNRVSAVLFKEIVVQ